MLHMPDRDYPKFKIGMRLTFDELCKAAAVGGYFIPSDQYRDHFHHMQRCRFTTALTRDYAKIGMRQGLHQSFDITFPQYFANEIDGIVPDDTRFLRFHDRTEW